MKSLLSIACFLLVGHTEAQFTSAEIGVDGLTCSMCAKAVEQSIREIPFVQDVVMNLRTTTVKVLLKKGEPVDIERLAMAVDDAGFSVGYLHASYIFNNISVVDGTCFTQDGAVYDFVGTGERVLNGETVLKFIGNDYLPSDEMEKWSQKLGSGCEKQGRKSYYITLSWDSERYN